MKNSRSPWLARLSTNQAGTLCRSKCGVVRQIEWASKQRIELLRRRAGSCCETFGVVVCLMSHSPSRESSLRCTSLPLLLRQLFLLLRRSKTSLLPTGSKTREDFLQKASHSSHGDGRSSSLRRFSAHKTKHVKWWRWSVRCFMGSVATNFEEQPEHRLLML